MPCYLCNAIPQHVPDAKAGNHLVQIGETEHSLNAAGQAVLSTQHKCSECGAEWRHLEDAADPRSGWEFIPSARRTRG